MRRLYASQFTDLEFCLGQMHQLTKDATGDDGPSRESVQALIATIDKIEQHCAEIGLTLSIKSLRECSALLRRAYGDAMTYGSGEGWPYVNRTVFDTGKRITDELETKFCFAVSADKVAFFDSADAFGNDVADGFRSAKFDISEAGKCLALGRNTACVFHLMRIMEAGLTALAKNFSIVLDRPDWHKMIDMIEAAIKAIPNDQNRPEDWRDKQTFFSQCASYFRVTKDAWRNYTAHGHSKYDEEEARDIYANVRGFMQRLSKRIQE